MKNIKKSVALRKGDSDYEEEDAHDSKTKLDNRRRPIKNWKKVWSEHTDDYDDVDDFFA